MAKTATTADDNIGFRHIDGLGLETLRRKTALALILVLTGLRITPQTPLSELTSDDASRTPLSPLC